MKTKRWIAAIAVLMLVVSTALTGCGSSTGDNSKGATTTMDKDQYLNVPLPADMRTLDLSKASDAYSKDVIDETEEGLARAFNTNGKTDDVQLTGASSVDVSSDGLTYTFHLRDLKWSDGKPVTAQDYVYSWQRLEDPKTASDYAYYAYVVKGAEEFNSGKGTADQMGVKAVDDKTFQVTLTHPVPYFIKMVAFSNLYPLRKDIVEAGGESYGQDPSKLVYNGPFTIDQWVKGSKVVIKKNPNYYDANSVKLSTVTYQIVKEEQPRMQMFTAAQIDVTGARGEYRTQFQNDAKAKGYQIVSGYAPMTAYEFYNANDKDKLFTNAKVRLAFSLAYNREDLIKNVFKRNYPAYGWVPYEVLNGDKEYRSSSPEPLKAAAQANPDPKALFQAGLKELGLDPSKTYTVHYLSSGTDTLSRTIAEWYQQQWQNNLGVKVVIDAVPDFPQFLDRVDKGDFQMGGMAWSGDYNDPMTFLDMFTTGNGNNPGKWSNAQYDQLVQEVQNTTDNTKRQQLFQQMEQLLLVDGAAISPDYYADKMAFIQPYVKGLQLPLFGPDYEVIHAYTSGRP